MTRATIIRGLKRALVRRVAPASRRDVAVLLAALEDQYAAVIDATEAAAFERGITEERTRTTQAETSGFQLGYKHGLEQAIGAIGNPARRVDEDTLNVTPS